MITEYRHRTGTNLLKLKGQDHLPLAAKEVTVRQTKHEFLFGCAEFSCVPLASGELDGREKELAEERFEKFFELFNFVTLPFYWGRFEPVKGKPDTERIVKGARWLISKGCTLKGHPLCWHTVTAPWLLEMTNADILKSQLSRIRREVSAFSGLVELWDVVNEAVIMPVFDKYDNGITRICQEMGRLKLLRETFLAAKKANPSAVLLLNDFETSEEYAFLIEACIESGIPIDAIGIQSHMHQGYWGVEKTLKVLERFSRFALPLHFTETTLVSGKIMPREIVDLNDYQVTDWPTTPEGEERQAQEAVLHYKTLFAHPLVQSITYWNFVDGGWLNAPAGFIRKDGTAKPMYHEILNLVKRDWWTKTVSLRTDDEGCVSITGYLGEYEVQCDGAVRSFVLEKSDRPIEIIM